MPDNVKIVLVFLFTIGIACLSPMADAQPATPALVDTNLSSGVQGQNLSYLSSGGTPTQRGKLFSESVRGNGSRAGYMLSHGGVIPNTLSISVGARTLRQNVDYHLDALNGVLFFTEPVKASDTIRASYRYVEGADSGRSPLGLQGLTLNLNGTAMSFDYGLSSDKARGLDFTTYGFSLAGKQGLNGLLYFSTPAGNSRNMVDDLSTAPTATTRKIDPKTAVSDHLISQSLNFNSGIGSFRATFQDVGANFGGFQAMRNSNSRNAEALKQIGALEKEKGIRRLGFGGGLNLGKTEKLDLDWNRVGDGKGDIVTQGLSLSAGALSLAYKTRSVGEGFTRFGDLREADKAQLAREKAMDRKDLTLALVGAKNPAFAFSQSTAGDKSGELSRQSFSLTSKTAAFSFSSRKAADGFKRISDLTDAEKAGMALDIRRQFNPNAAAGEVTAKDIAQIGLEAGLARNRMSLTSKLGKQGGFSFGQFGIDDGKGSIARRTLELKTGALSFSHTHQRIAEEFGRLANLSEFERTQFGNERGITRDAMAFNLGMGKGSGFSFSQLKIADKAGGMERQSLALESKGVAFKLNLADTDKSFMRAADLAITDPEKALIERERGFRSTDFAAHVAAVKGLTLDTFNLNARNSADNLAKNGFKHALGWKMGKGANLSLLSEGSSLSGVNGLMHQMKHQLIDFDRHLKNGVKVHLFHDVLETVTADKTSQVTTDFVKVESDLTKPARYLAEMKLMDMGGGKFENTTKMDLNYMACKELKLRLNTLRIDRGDDPSSVTDTVEWKYQINKTLYFTGLNSDTNTNNEQDGSTRSLGLDGKLSENLNFKGAYTEVNHEDNTVKTVSDIGISMSKPMDMMGMEDVTLSAKYAAVNDADSKVTEMAAGRIQGKLGENLVMAEYGGTLDEKGNAGIARTVSFSSPKNEKNPVQVDLMYKARNVNRTAVQLVRKYDLGLKVLPRLAITYKYISLPEDPALTMQQTKSSGFGLRYGLNKKFNLGLDYATAQDLVKNSSLRRLVTCLTGKLDRLAAVEVVYTVDLAHQGANSTDAHTIKLSYDRQVDGDHFVTFTTTYVDYRAGGLDDLQARVEFKTRF